MTLKKFKFKFKTGGITWGRSEWYLPEYQVLLDQQTVLEQLQLEHLGGRDITGVFDVFDYELIGSGVQRGQRYCYLVVGIKAAGGCLITVSKIRGLDKSNTFLSFGDIKFVWEDQSELAGI